METWKEIAVAWSIALVLLVVGIGAAEFAARQPPNLAAPTALRFAEALPRAADALASFDDDVR